MHDSNPRRHHFVPAWLLRRFADKDGFIWWWSKELDARNVLRQKPEEVFCRRDLNTRVLDDGALDQSVEIGLGVLDNEIKDITQKLLEQGRASKPPTLTLIEKGILDRFLSVQFKRSPEWRTSEMEQEVFREMTGNEMPDDMPTRIGARTCPSVASDARNALQNDYVESLLFDDPYVANVLSEKGLLILRVPHGEALVVGTSVVVSAGTGAGSLCESYRGLALPLASDILLYVGKSKEVREVLDLSVEEVNMVNRQIAIHCYGIAAKSENLVRSFVPQKALTPRQQT